ncbi:MAG: type II toxin-antitoxin system VapC family toxin [Desulfobacteraceae bacterium]|nr:MAG: type II toxin-antitoxin system VapC family toxin [Desulfobacteraceae bacterium]
MEDSFLPDTDVLIDFLRGFHKAVDFITTNSHKIVLSPIVVAELYAGVKGPSELTVLDNFVSLFTVIPVTPAIARAAGLHKRDFGKSHGVGLADAIIAATCESANAALITLNVKHYPMIKDLKPAYGK